MVNNKRAWKSFPTTYETITQTQGHDRITVCVSVCERESEGLYTVLHHCTLIPCVHSLRTYQTNPLFIYFLFFCFEIAL